MTNLQRVSPSIVDGIEFYVSADGKEVGMSQRGLARLCGVTDQAMSRLVSTGSLPKALEGIQGKLFSDQLEGAQNAKILTSEACVAIIEYYAFSSPKRSEIASFSFRRFARLGFDRWVKDITGYAVNNDMGALMATMQQVLGKVEQLTVEVREYHQIRQATTTFYPGLDSMLDSLPASNTLPPSSELTTAKEWLAMKGITLTPDRLSSFGRLVADTYKSMTGEFPRDKNAKVKGKWQNIGKGYSASHFPILETAWKQFGG